MTHTLHRFQSASNRSEEFVFLCTPAKGINTEGAAPKLRRILKLLYNAGPANIGFYGCNGDRPSYEDIERHLTDHSRLRCLFDDRTKVVHLLRRIKAEEAGLSIAVTGSLSQVLSIAREAGLTPHTVNLSLGVFGKTERLPPEEILEVSTMCGHGIISFQLVEAAFEDVRRGKRTVEEAWRTLDRPCSCGLVNPARTRAILEKEAGSIGSEVPPRKPPESSE
jgi:hypothetical protein